MASSKEETQQAFRSLIHSVTNAGSASNGPKSNLSAEAIDRLTERLSEIVGLDAEKDFAPQRNERGELVNEEGLPIIDITEPISEYDEPREYVYVDVDPIVPFDKIDERTKERLRQQRERMLDMLEREEREEEAKQKAKEKEEYDALVKKKAESASNEEARLKAAKEMQKRMGKALLRNMADTRDKEASAKEVQRLKDEEEDAKRKAGSAASKKKNVSFASDVASKDEEKEETSSADWGDVVPATLKPTKRPTLLSQQSDRAIMKMQVVERAPGAKRPPSPVPKVEKDSDDESDFENDDDDEGSQHGANVPSLTSNSDGSDLEDEELEEETDLDFANMQRQIELEYYSKRETIGQQAAVAMEEIASQPEEVKETEDNAGVSFEEPSKPSISQFRATRLASAYGASTPSTAPRASDFVVPASTAKTIQKTIRTGKLDKDGNLVGGENDSDSEAEDEGMQEILELLKKGEVYNIGPNGEYIHTVPPPSKDAKPSNGAAATATSSALRLDDPNPERSLPPLATKTPTSKFKLSRGAANNDALSPSPTPVNELRRSSPKPGATPITPTQAPPPPVARFANPPVGNPMSMIVESPSFPRLGGNAAAGAPPNFSMIVESPSFPQTPAMKAASATAANGLPLRSSSRPDRPPTVMSTTVRESKPTAAASPVAPETPNPSEPPRKVSRFKQQRS